jgi:hypothetical protein
VGFGQEVDVGSRYGSLLFANAMIMLGTTNEKLKNHLIFRLCRLVNVNRPTKSINTADKVF